MWPCSDAVHHSSVQRLQINSKPKATTTKIKTGCLRTGCKVQFCLHGPCNEMQLEFALWCWRLPCIRVFSASTLPYQHSNCYQLAQLSIHLNFSFLCPEFIYDVVGWPLRLTLVCFVTKQKLWTTLASPDGGSLLYDGDTRKPPLINCTSRCLYR